MSITEDLEGLVHNLFTHEPTPCQSKAIAEWTDFMLSREADAVFLLRGYAGTGKTSLVSAMVNTLRQLQQPVMLLAPTGRAAKVFSLYSGTSAYTIHRKIYRQKTLTDPDSFQANVNLHKFTTFIVDEASMISNGVAESGISFGTGRLLDDLIHYVYSCEGCRLMLIGDSAQLPPVGTDASPALNEDMLRGYGLTVWQAEMTEVVRQASTSGILWNATMLRQMLAKADEGLTLPRFRIQGMPDIQVVNGDELIDSLESSFSRCGIDDTVVVTRSNKRANIFNQGIRARILYMEEELCGGDQILIAKNNYYWTEKEAQADKQKEQGMAFIANGDIAIVRRVHHERELYGFRFADATITFPDYAHREMDVTVLLSTLSSEAPALSKQQQEDLFRAVWEDYPEIGNKRERMKKLRTDPYYNALQIKYSYAITCHKAQGGQWSHVYIDQGYMTEEMLTPEYLRWLYTAITRATEKVFLINWPPSQSDC
ncbi:MAG: AAA family ATPase [Bacteroidaceae bacterium]|nr:AAA family ATPase [Bacteroidaceae bacterium]